MKLEKEIERTWIIAMGLAWAIIWRIFVVAIPISLLVRAIPEASTESGKYLHSFIEFVANLAIFIGAIYWLLGRGYSSKKIILMEQAHYQELIAGNEVEGSGGQNSNQSLKSGTPQSGAP